jgi:hypothetical protein
MDDRWWSFPRIAGSGALSGLRGVYCVIQRLPVGYRTIWVGQGSIGDRLADHMRQPSISARPYLLVTWAETDPAQTDGIQKYLIDALHPVEGETIPVVEPIEVNLPYCQA